MNRMRKALFSARIQTEQVPQQGEEMKKVFMVLAAALIALPIFATPKPTPTPTPAVNRVKSKSNITNNKVKDEHSGDIIIKEGAPGTPMPTPSAEKAKDGGPRLSLNTNITSKEGAPVTPTVGPAESSNLNSSRSNTFRVQPSPTAGPVGTTAIKGTKSNTSDKEGAPTTPSPTVGPANAINLNSSRSNVEREAAPGTPTVTPPLPNGSRDKLKGTSKTAFEREQMQPKYKAGRVLSQQGRRLTVQLSDGSTVAVDSAGLNPVPRVGSTVSVTNSRGSWVIVTR